MPVAHSWAMDSCFYLQLEWHLQFPASRLAAHTDRVLVARQNTLAHDQTSWIVTLQRTHTSLTRSIQAVLWSNERQAILCWPWPLLCYTCWIWAFLRVQQCSYSKQCRVHKILISNVFHATLLKGIWAKLIIIMIHKYFESPRAQGQCNLSKSNKWLTWQRGPTAEAEASRRCHTVAFSKNRSRWQCRLSLSQGQS